MSAESRSAGFRSHQGQRNSMASPPKLGTGSVSKPSPAKYAAEAFLENNPKSGDQGAWSFSKYF